MAVGRAVVAGSLATTKVGAREECRRRGVGAALESAAPRSGRDRAPPETTLRGRA